jgi:CDP-diglyceride synthetase
VDHFELHLHPKIEGFLTAAQVTFFLSLLTFGAIWGAFTFGRWLGGNSAAPSQAVISDGAVYGWLGTTADGLVVARTVDFCGATTPEEARFIRVSGARSTLLQAEGLEVIRLSSNLRLVDRCP